MKSNNEIQEDYQLYMNGKNYNNRLHPPYYPTIDKNERFYVGDHWYGVQAGGYPTLIMPAYSRIADHEIASILSNPLKMKFSIDNFESGNPKYEEMQKKVDMLNYKCDEKWEKDKINTLLRECLTDGFNSGDYAIYVYWDKSKRTKQYHGLTVEKDNDGNVILDENGKPKTKEQEILGDFCNEVKDGSEIMFGNPNDRRVQTQPYILVIGREIISNLRKEAKENGVSKDDYMAIVSDQETSEQVGDRGKIELDTSSGDEHGKCLYIIKMWKKDGEVYYRKSTKFTMIIKEQKMGLTLYPVAWGNWKKRKNSYHGQAPGTQLVPNQISINQMYSMVVYHMRMTAFGKVLYDKSRISAWNNAIGAAIGVEGDTTGAVYQLSAGQMNNNIFSFMDNVISQTKDLNGANDAALGDVNPEQASGTAIVATAQQSAIPLENPQSNLEQFVEDLGLIWQDFIQHKYIVPRKVGYKQDGEDKVGSINGSYYENIPLSLKIDVGPSTQWSELTSVATLDKLLLNKQITFLQYLERLPDGFINDKQSLIDEIRSMTENQNNLVKNNYEQMAQFFDTLPPNIQEELKKLPDNQMEEALMQMMAEQNKIQQPNMNGGM